MPLGFPYMEGNSIHREQHCLLRNSAWSTDGFLSGAHVCNNELNTDPGQPDRVFFIGLELWKRSDQAFQPAHAELIRRPEVS